MKAKTAKKTSKSTGANLALGRLNFSRKQVVVLALVLALIGVYIIYRSHAATSTLVGPTDFRSDQSAGALRATDHVTVNGSKQDVDVVALASGSGNKAVFISTVNPLDAGVYKVCLNGRVPADGGAGGNFSAMGYNNGPTGNLAATQYLVSKSDQFKEIACITNLSLSSGQPGIELIVDNTGTQTLNISGFSVVKTGEVGGGNPLPYKASGNNDALPSKLIFDDEFNGNGLNQNIFVNGTTSNAAVWAPVWFHDNNSSNGTNMKISNASVSGGYLNLHVDGQGNGGIVSSNPSDGYSGHTGFQYSTGYAEARVCLPASSDGKIANWPAWWTDGQNWPGDGEQDIMEGLSGTANATWHGYTSGSSGVNYGRGGARTGCHIFASYWQNGLVKSYYDGSYLGSYSNPEVVTKPQYLIIENSTGQWGHQPIEPATIQVDYVRVWQ